jgi:hypothetical protein
MKKWISGNHDVITGWQRWVGAVTGKHETQRSDNDTFPFGSKRDGAFFRKCSGKEAAASS